MVAEIVVVPVGKIQESVLAHICRTVTEIFSRPCHVGPALSEPDYAWEPRRKQYSAQKILHQLHSAEAERVLGVADRDLFVSELNFVFGLADAFGRRAVIALPRLRQQFYGLPEDVNLFLQRVAKEAIHELGHTYHLSHCTNRQCVMSFSNSLQDTDIKSREFCQNCRKGLNRQLLR